MDLIFVVLGVSVIIQHFSKVGKIVFAIFSSISAGLIGAVWMPYDTVATKYFVMAVCILIVAILNYASWMGMKDEYSAKLQTV